MICRNNADCIKAIAEFDHIKAQPHAMQIAEAVWLEAADDPILAGMTEDNPRASRSRERAKRCWALAEAIIRGNI